MSKVTIPNPESAVDIIDNIHYVHANLEVPNWAPWLAFSLDNLVAQSSVFPEGQFTVEGEDGVPIGALSTNRINWSGFAEDLTTWDVIAGEDASYRDTYEPSGNTLSFMSMSIDPSSKGQRVSSRLVDQALAYAQEEGLEHIIGDFRPSNYGSYKRESGNFDFSAYCQLKREDGQHYDGWLRSLGRLDMQPLKLDNRSMVAQADRTEFDEYKSTYNPEKWWQVIDQEVIGHLLKWYDVGQDLDNVDEVWECEEAGTWFVDNESGTAIYFESNVWGEIPTDLASVDSPEYAAVEANYHMCETDLISAQEKLVSAIETLSLGVPGIYGAWIPSDHEFANLIRTFEENTEEFKGIESVVSDVVEQRSVFFTLVDTRVGSRRLIHGTRLSGAVFQNKALVTAEALGDSTGFIAIDELTQSGQEFTVQDFYRYHEEHGIDLAKCVGVETNFTIGVRTETEIPNLRVSDLGYIAIFNQLEKAGLELGKSGIFAFINKKTNDSLGSLGVSSEPLVGRPDLRAPSLEGGLDSNFRPVLIPTTAANVGIFDEIKALGVPEFDIAK